jgi:hypothetical protein
MNDLIYPGTFCKLNTNKFKTSMGVPKGTLLFVAGAKAVPEDENDPYTQRVKFLVHLVDDDGDILVEDGVYLVDPKSVRALGKKRQELLIAQMEKKYGDDGEGVTEH